jgi:hypothetical protein
LRDNIDTPGAAVKNEVKSGEIIDEIAPELWINRWIKW